MIIELQNCRVHFPDDYDARGEWEVEQKGWLQGVRVELSDGSCYPLFFYDPVRLAQDLEADNQQGRIVMAEPGLVVVATVTRDTILRAVSELLRSRYFNHLKPLSSPVANGVPG